MEPSPASLTIPAPSRVAMLPLCPKRAIPVPWFVAWIDGVPDFRVIAPGKIAHAVKFKVCWLCGKALGRNMTFVIGPMCAVNRTSSEPPCHSDCAEYAARACPWLATPKRKRREDEITQGGRRGAGEPITRNPGVTLLWDTRSYTVFRPHVGNPGVLFEIGPADRVRWFAEAREATRSEILHSIETGLPVLREAAEAEGDEAKAALDRMIGEAMKLLPAEAA